MIAKLTNFKVTNGVNGYENRPKMSVSSPLSNTATRDIFVKQASFGNNVQGTRGNAASDIKPAIDEQKTLIDQAINTIKKSTDNIADLVNTKASTDFLTGLKNKDALLQDLSKCIEDSKQNGTNFSLAMFDMDNFKAVNEFLGYTTGGDKFIRIIGEDIKEVATKHGVQAYRFGGEEFVVIYKGDKNADAHKISDEIRVKLNNNKKLQDDVDTFSDNGKEKIVKLQQRQCVLDEIQDCKQQYANSVKLLNKRVKTKGNTQDETNLFLQNDVNENYSLLNKKVKDLKEKAVEKVSSTEEKKMLETKFAQLNAMDFLNDEEVNNCLKREFDRSFDIAQRQMWVSGVNKLENGKKTGFTITCGVKEFKAGASKKPNAGAADYIDEVGEVLKKGKDTGKGKLYVG